jgi:GntR family transcriptional regulator
MPIKGAQPKYATMVNAIQQRIEDGTYPPGSALPSEQQFVVEFKVSRPTVVRALGILQQDGWIDAEQGKGRFVRSRSSYASRRAPSQAAMLLQQTSEVGKAKVVKAGPVLAPDWAADALRIEEGTPVLSRQLLVVADAGPIELSTSYVPVELSAKAGLGDKQIIPEGLLRRLTVTNGAEFDHATEQISARFPTELEAKLLDVGAQDCMLTVMCTAFDRHANPQLVVEVVIPASRHELVDTFPLE